MPMIFPDMKHLVAASKVWGFRPPNKDEKEKDYRVALADFVQDKDLIESMEIRTGVGWDQFTEEQNLEMVSRRGAVKFR